MARQCLAARGKGRARRRGAKQWLSVAGQRWARQRPGEATHGQAKAKQSLATRGIAKAKIGGCKTQHNNLKGQTNGREKERRSTVGRNHT